MKVFEISDDASYQDVVAYATGRDEDAERDKSAQERNETTQWIVEAVRKNGDAALADFTLRFDGVELLPSQFELSRDEIEAAIATVDPKLMAVLKRAHENIRRFHTKHLRESWEENYEDGTILGQRITPIESAGVYVPGGKAFYPSSVLMNIVPARVAGVEEIVMVSPPTWHGTIHPGVLAAAYIAGATRIFRVGGAQAVAALAYGTETIPAVAKITGPGNAYVTAAKALVRKVVEIDSEAGPSEVVVIADDKAEPAYVAFELLAQAEHDEDARSILVTTSAALAKQVRDYVAAEVKNLQRKAIIWASLETHGAIIIVRDLDEAIRITNILAPEHLSIQTMFPKLVAEQIRNAGAMMLGPMTPVAVGDYYAGPNHILPTGRRARFSSPLTAEDFRKVSSILFYTRDRLLSDAEDIIALATLEELEAHARSVEIRTPSQENSR